MAILLGNGSGAPAEGLDEETDARWLWGLVLVLLAVLLVLLALGGALPGASGNVGGAANHRGPCLALHARAD